jgi:hypothetical protein
MSDTLTSKPIEHKKLGVKAVLHDFNQRQYEQYHELLFASDARTVAVKNGVVVVSAIKAGFLTGLEVEEVPSMSPAAVMWLTSEIHNHVVEVTSPPPNDPN